MGLLRRLLGGDAGTRQFNLSLTNFTEQRPEAELEIVGEASYQDALEKVAGALGWDGALERDHKAIIVREPENRYDPNAIAIYLRHDEGAEPTMYKAGYLSRENAIQYQPVFGLLSGNGIMASARLKGGWRRGEGDVGSIGVVINLGSPAELAAELLVDRTAPARGHRWDGRMVCFTGESWFAIRGVRLDHLGQQYLARRAGCKTWPRITKQVEVCVTSDPEAVTGKLQKAEQYGLELVPEWEFWPGLGIELDRA